MKKKKEEGSFMKYPKGLLFESSVLGDEADTEAGAMEVGRTFRRVHSGLTDVTDSSAGHFRWSGDAFCPSIFPVGD